MNRLCLLSLIVIFLSLFVACSNEEPTIMSGDFTATQLELEEGDSTEFVDLSTEDPTSWNWTFAGGEPASSTEQNPTVTYPVAGTYDVSLIVSNDNSADTVTKAGYITVNKKPAPFQELYDQGIDRYLGVFTPASSSVVSPGLTEHVFTGIDGPICFTGNQFSMFTRDGSSNNLMIFLQGGGFCSPVICEAVEEGIPYIPFGILSPSDPQNPVANYNVGYVPYCDGSMMAGDNEVDSDGDGVNDRLFKGLQNLSASLDVIAQNYSSPEKIVLAGNSAGGFAVHVALPLVRKLYPEARIYIINDSGQGIGNPGGFEGLFNYWNSYAYIPSSCTDCIGSDGNLTGIHNYQLQQDDNIRMAYISSKQDSIGSASMGGPAFEAQLLEAATELNNAHPERFQSLIDNGDAHTYIIRSFNVEVGGVTVRQWLADMINESEDWDTVIE